MGRLAVYKFAYFLSILFTIFILGLSIFAYFSGKINPVENMLSLIHISTLSIRNIQRLEQ